MTGFTNAVESKSKLYKHYCSCVTSTDVFNLYFMSTEVDTKINTFSDLQSLVTQKKVLLVNGVGYVYGTTTNNMQVYGISGVGSAGMSGTPYIMFYAYKTSDNTYYTPMLEVQTVITFSASLTY